MRKRSNDMRICFNDVIKLIALFIIVSISKSCTFSYEEPYLLAKYEDSVGVKRNDIRVQDSLPIVPENWVIVIRGKESITWAKSENFREKKGHAAKTVGLNEFGEVLYEEDMYNSGLLKHCIETDNELYYESISVKYDYSDNLIMDYPWSTEGRCCEEYYELQKDYLKIVDRLLLVDTILSRWGVERLNW